MALATGSRIGAYEIVGPLGAGGMGEVYRARDTRLNRDVALKILPEQFANQPERVARFEREAHLLASLNHPHIAQIYAVENIPSTSSGQVSIRALAMELVEGTDLSAVIAGRRLSAPAAAGPSESASRGPAARGGGAPRALKIDESLAIARQIAEALEAAHEKGIIHRDLKPGNVMVTPDGEVKLLDFGLGKSLAAEAEGDASDSPTMTAAATQMGVLLGTAAYMAPEQAKGHVVDKRGDIWAFGCVLYEMLTGTRAFAGEDVSDTLAAILRGEPDWSALPADTPTHIRRLLTRCLEKDRKRRLRDIGDVLLELTEPDAGAAAATAAPATTISPRATWRVYLMSLAGALCLAAIATAVTWRARTPASEPETRLDITTPTTPGIGVATTFALSPDGRQVVYAAPSGGQIVLWLRPLDSTAARPLAGTDGGVQPFWSPDGRSIGFFTETTVKRLDIAGGAPITLASRVLGASGGSWSSANVILLRQGSVLVRVPASGGAVTPVTKLAEGAVSHAQPQFLPDGRQFIFFCNGPDNVRGVYLGALDDPAVTRLTDADAAARYVAPGWLLYIQQGALVARRLDVQQRTLAGDPVPIAENVAANANENYRQPALAVSASGTLAYRTDAFNRRQLAWFDRNGAQVGTMGAVDVALIAPELSPDAKRVAGNRTVPGNADIWVIDALRMTRLTFDPGAELFPLWSPDGSQIAFRVIGNRKEGAYVKASSGAGAETLLVERPDGVPVMNGLTSWSRDGRFILGDVYTSSGAGDVLVYPLTGDRKPYPFLNGTYIERLAHFSPDGRWVAYQSFESGRSEIYIRPFPGPGGQWQVSTAGGAQPRWRHDGKELYWIAPDAKLMAAPIVVSGNSVEPGTPVALFQTRIFLGGTDQPNRGQYNVASDGRFLINTVLDEGSSPITIVQHWQGLKR